MKGEGMTDEVGRMDGMGDERQQWVDQVAELWDREAELAGCKDWRDLSSGILLHIAAGHSTSITAPEEPGTVCFRVEAVPFHPGANGEEYMWGRLTAEEAARELRQVADRCQYWTAEKVERP